jgi:glycosyltransferase involved in cell wall biosynthesis
MGTGTRVRPPLAIESSDPFAFFDYFRVPYQLVQGTDRHRWREHDLDPLTAWASVMSVSDHTGNARRLYWSAADAGSPHDGRKQGLGRYRLDGIPIFGHVKPDEQVRGWLSQTGSTWWPTSWIVDHAGSHVASVWRSEHGDTFLPFDPGELIGNLWSERYQEIGRSSLKRTSHEAALQTYYLLRPLIGRDLQLRLRRSFSKWQGRGRFPSWPVETALHDFYEWLFRQVAILADGPVPWIAPWPDGSAWALVLTHDVETQEGCRRIDVLRGVERPFGFRSSWNFVPMRYTVVQAELDALTDEGCEVGVHGLYHDGRDLSSLRMIKSRLPVMREYADRWNALGFRSPATHRVWDWMPLLGFDYDSSYPDADPYEPQPGGCCSLLPFFNRGTVELPITLAQDHTLFEILQHPDGAVWEEKVDHIRSNGGMALALTHPDYSADARIVAAYRSLLETYGSDTTVWQALPREVSAWWRRRADSRIEATGDGWKITGPAAKEGRIAFAEPPPAIPSSLEGSPPDHQQGTSAPSMRIAMLSCSIYEGDNRVKRAVGALVDRGHEVDLLCLGGGSTRGTVQKGSLRITYLPMSRERSGSTRYVFEYLAFFLWATTRISLSQLRQRYDVVYVHNMPNFLVFSATLPKIFGAKVVLDVHDPATELLTEIRGRRLPPWLRRLLRTEERLSVSFSDAVITVNEPMRQRMLQTASRPVPVAVVMNLPDPRLFKKLSSAGEEPTGPLLVYCGTVAKRNGPDLAVRALALLAEEFPSLRLRIVGPGPAARDVAALSKELGIADRVDMLGNVPSEEIPALVRDATAGLSLHRNGVFGSLVFSTKAAEYVRLGLPVICARTSTMRQYFSDDEFFFFEPGDPGDLARTVRDLLNDPASAEERRARSLQRLEELDWVAQITTLSDTVEALGHHSRSMDRASNEAARTQVGNSSRESRGEPHGQ